MSARTSCGSSRCRSRIASSACERYCAPPDSRGNRIGYGTERANRFALYCMKTTMHTGSGASRGVQANAVQERAAARVQARGSYTHVERAGLTVTICVSLTHCRPLCYAQDENSDSNQKKHEFLRRGDSASALLTDQHSRRHVQQPQQQEQYQWVRHTPLPPAFSRPEKKILHRPLKEPVPSLDELEERNRELLAKMVRL